LVKELERLPSGIIVEAIYFDFIVVCLVGDLLIFCGLVTPEYASINYSSTTSFLDFFFFLDLGLSSMWFIK